MNSGFPAACPRSAFSRLLRWPWWSSESALVQDRSPRKVHVEVLEARIAPASVLTISGSDIDISEDGGSPGADTLSVQLLSAGHIRITNPAGIVPAASYSGVTTPDGQTIDVDLTVVGTGLFSIDGGTDTDSITFDAGHSFGSVLASAESIQLGSLSTAGAQTYHSADITFASNSTLDSTLGGAAGANITLDGPIKSTSGNYRTLTITAGTSGDAIFGDGSGSGDANFATGTDALGGLSITAEVINFQSDVAAVRTGGTTSSISLTSTGASALSIGTNVYVDGAGNVSMTGVGITQTSGSTIAPSNGSVTLDGTGGTVDLSGSVSGTSISLIGPVTQDAGSVLTTGSVSVTAGSGNDVSLHGTGNAFSALTIVSAHDVDAFSTTTFDLAGATVSNDFTATSSVALTLSGTVSVTNQLTLDAGTTITQSAGSISAAVLSTSSHGAQTLTSTGNTVGSFTATNTTAATDISLANGVNGFQIGAITNNGGAVIIDNTNGGATDTATLAGALDSGGGNVLIATSGGLTLSANLSAGAGTVRLVSGAAGVTQSAGAVTASALGVRSTGAISLTGASNDVDTLAAFTSLTTGTGIDFRDADTLTIGSVGASGLFAATAGVTTSNAGIAIVTAGDLTISDIPAVSPEVSAGTGLTSLTAGTAGTDAQITVASGAVLAANNNQLRLIADHIDLSGDISLTGASSSVLLRPFEAGTTIDLGGADAATVLGLSDTELDHVTGPSGSLLIIGSLTGGSIAFTSAIDTANIARTNLLTGGTVTQNAGATITETDFSVASTGAVTLTENNSVTNFAASVSGAGNAIQFKNTGALTITGPINGVNGVSTNGGGIAITTVNGGITVNDTAASADLNAGSGSITLTAGSSSNDNVITIASGANVTATGGVTLVADGMSILGTVTATGALVTLRPFENGTVVNLGGADAAATLGLTDGELDQITAATIKIGDANTGAISISSALDTANTGLLSLQTGSTISQSAAITEGSLALRAVGGITLTNSSNSIGTLATSITGSGNALQFVNNGGFTIGTVDSVTGASTTDGAISLNSGTGTLTISNAVNAGTSSVTLTGDDAAINATVTGNSGITVQPSTGSRSIFLNNSGTGLSLATAELTNLATTGTLTIGASGGTGAIGIGNTAALALGSTNYSLTLRGGAVTFSNGITLNSSKTFTFDTAGITNGTGTEVTSSGGTLVLNTTGAVTMDSAVANFGASTVSGGAVSVTNSGSFTVSGAVAASSNLTLSTTGANTDLTISSTITGTAANLAFNAVRTITVGQAVSTTGAGTLTLSGNSGAGARDIVINAALSTVNGALSIDADQGTGVSGTFAGVTVNATVSVSGTGALTVAGRGGSGTGANAGVLVQGGADLIAGTSTTGTITGVGGASSTDGNVGVRVTGSGSTITSNGAAIQVTGTGGGASTAQSNYGVGVDTAGVITAGGTGTVTVQGTGGAIAASFMHGVDVRDAGSAITSNNGAVSVTGTGGGSGASASARGVSISNGGVVTTGGAATTVTVSGTGGTGTGGSNAGVWIGTSSAMVTSGGGAVSVTGSAGAGAGSFGLDLNDTGGSVTTATNGGNISLIGDSMNLVGTVTGNGASSITLRQNTNGTTINLGGADAAGVLGLTDAELDQVTGGNILIGNSNTGTITVASTALTQSAKNFTMTTGSGITVDTATFTTTGNVTLSATSGAIINNGGSISAATLTTSSANGTSLLTSVTTLSATNSTAGNITITEADAVSISQATNTGTNGAVSLSTTSGSITTTGTISSNGSGTITILPGGAGNGLTLGGNLTAGSGAVTITADTIALNGGTDSVSGTGSLTLRPLTTSASIGLGDSAAGTFSLSNTEIAALKDGFSAITIGNTTATHTVTIDANSASLTFKDPVTIRSGNGAAGSITMASGTSLVGTGNATLTLNTGGAVTLNGSLSTSNNTISVVFGQGGTAVNATIGALNAGGGSASVTGGGGVNVITLTSTANPFSVNGAGGADTLVAPNATNTWSIGATTTLNSNVSINNNIPTYQGGTGADTFNLTANRTLTLKGGAGADSFVFSNGVVLTGSIDGEAGSDTLNVSAYVTAVNISISGAGATDGVNGTSSPAVASAGFSNINVLSGSGTFTGANADSTWAVGSTVTYTTSGGTVSLTGYTTLQGGSGVDTFNVTNGNTIGLMKGGAGNDSLNLSYTGGNPIPVSGLTFNGEGNTGSGDSITVSGGSATTITHTFTNANDGFIDIDGRVVTYTGLEPITDSMSATNRVFTFNGGTETITLVDAAGANMTIDSTASESVTFANPTSSLTINAGDGDDTMTITSMDAAYTGSLTVNGGTGTDSLTFTAASPSLSALTINTDSLGALPTLSIGAGGMNITTTASDITQSGGITVTGTTTLNAGANAITLSHASNNFGTVTATVTGTSGITLNDSTGGITLGAISALLASDVSVTTAGNGDITVSGVLNAPSAAVSLDSDNALALGNNIIADTLGLTADTTINQSAGFLSTTGAVTAIAAGDISLTNAANTIAAFIATNTGSGSAILLENGFDGLQIGAVTSNHGPITIHNTNGGPSDDATVVGAVSTGGTSTGDVFISTEGRLTVTAPVSTAGGSGGTLTLSGAVTLTGAGSPTIGAGDIVLQGGDGDLLIGADLTLATSYTLTSKRNIVIDANVTTTGATSDLTITADSDHDQVGGVYVKQDGFISAGRDLFIGGSALTNDVGIAETNQAVRIDGEGTVAVPVVQVQAVRNIVIGSSVDAPANVTAIAGYITNTNTGALVGNIEFTGPVDVIDNTAFVSAGGAGSLLFDDVVDSTGGYDLKLRSTLGNINFLDKVGDSGPLGAIAVVNAGNVTASSTVEAESVTITKVLGTATFQDTVTLTAASGTSFAVHGDTLVVNQVSAGAGDILWDVDNLTISDTVAGTGSIAIQPNTVSRSIGLNGAGDLSIDSTEIGRLQAGFDMITIGRTDGTGTLTTSGANFHDALTLLAPSGTININGKVATTDAAKSITVQANLLKLNVDSASDDALSTEGGSITIANTNVSLLKDTKISTSTGAVGGDVTFTATINGNKDFVVDAFNDAAGGDVTFNGTTQQTAPWSSIGGTTALRSITVNAANISHYPNTLTSGSQTYHADGTITTHGGHLFAGSAGDITLDGELHVTGVLAIEGRDVEVTGRIIAENLSSLQFESDTVASSPVVTVDDTTGLFVGQRVSGPGIPFGTTISSIDDGTHLTLSKSATASATAYLAYGGFGAASVTGTAAVGTDTFALTSGNTSGLYVGQPIYGPGVNGATVTQIIDSTHFEISANVSSFAATASITSSALKATATAGTNSFTLTSGSTASLRAGQGVTSNYLPAGTKILAITGPTTFTTTSATVASAVNPTVGFGTDAAISIVNTGEVHFGDDLGNDSTGHLTPLYGMSISGATLVEALGNVRVINTLNLTASELDFKGGADSIHASALNIIPKSTAQNVGLGAAVEALGSAQLELSAADVLALGGDITLLTIGTQTSTGTMSVEGAVTFNSPTKMQVGPTSPSKVDINADVTVTGSAPLTIVGALIDLGADITMGDGTLLFDGGTKLGNVKVTSPSTITSAAGTIYFNTQLYTNATLDITSASGPVAFKNFVSLGADMSVTATTSSVTFSGAIFGTTTSDLTVSAPSGTGNVTFSGKIGDGTVAHRPGQITVNNGGLATFNYVDAMGLTTDAAGATLLRGGVNVWSSGGIQFNDPVSVGATITVASRGTGPIDFVSTLDASGANRGLTINSVSGDITLQDEVGSITPFSTLNVRSTSGDVVADAAITSSSVALTGVTVDANAGIVTTKGITLIATSGLDATTLTAGGQVYLKSNTGHLHVTGAINAGGAVTAISTSAPITFDSTVGAGGAISVTSSSGNLTFSDSVVAVGAFTAKTTTGDVTISDTVTASAATVQGDDVHTYALISTTGTGNQSYTGLTGVILDDLAGGGNLTVTSKHNISNTGSWQFGGKAVLVSTSTLGTEGITVTGSGNSFGSVSLTGHKATLEADGNLNVVYANITRVGVLGGTLTLTANGGDITQTGAVTAYKLIASATSVGKKITFGLGTLRVNELGKLEAGSDILIVRGANSNLLLKDTITSTAGDVVIVADYGTTTGNVRNDVVTPNPITVGSGKRFLIYAYDESASQSLLSGISADTYLPSALQPRRYSPVLTNAGNPSQIPGTYFVFARR